jgi:GTP-binding protein EngB required for normal cell division
VKLADTIGRWLGRVEVVLAGADDILREGEQALVAGDAMAARSAARNILERVPGSPIGLALLADACETAGLDAELALTLEELAQRVARGDVWVRLGHARQATGAPVADVREAFVRGLASAESGSEARRDALLALADLDIAQRDGSRAELWLDRVAADKSADVVLRRAEAKLAQGDVAAARLWLGRLEEEPTDPRAAIARGRALALSADPGAFVPLVRAMVLDAPGASELLSSSLAWIPIGQEARGRILRVVEAKGEAHLARWRAAFARADGRRDEARAALRDALAAGDASAARPLLDAALDDHDYPALVSALAALPPEARSGSTVRDAELLPSPAVVLEPSKLVPTLDVLARVTNARVAVWADRTRDEIARALLPTTGTARWDEVLARLDMHARELHDIDAMAKIAAISAERVRPVRLAIVGEFNAGKSTFINALMGADIAPTGVLPTTATLHHLRYAPDPIAHILLKPAARPTATSAIADPLERVVPVGDLRATLKSMDATTVRRVEIMLPIASLTRVEILDTPGFNAPDARHTEVARAAFEEADACVWLLDAGQAFKQTERAVLEEARAARLPVQILVNKADRIATTELPKVMQLVLDALVEIKLASWSPPVAFSARLALAGKLGDAAALAASGWEEVEALLQAQVIARSEELKERSLRRRARVVIAQLTAAAKALAEHEEAVATRAAESAQRASRAAASLDRELDDATVRVAKALEPAAVALRHELQVLVTGRDAESAAKDPVLARYRVERALAQLAPPLAATLARIAAGGDVTAEEITPLSRAVVRAFAGVPRTREQEREPPATTMLPLARAAVTALIEHLGAKAVGPAVTQRAGGQVRELYAFEHALS